MAGRVRVLAVPRADASEVARLILAVRSRCHLPQAALGQRLGGLHRTTISAWERGAAEPPVHLLAALRLLLAQELGGDVLSLETVEAAAAALLRIELDARSGVLSEDHRRALVDGLTRALAALGGPHEPGRTLAA